MDNAMLGAISYYTSCTPHKHGVRIHIDFGDFDDITGGDRYASDALSAFEAATNQRIGQLRERYGIPETHLPAAFDLWFSMPYRKIEVLTCRRVSKSVCQRVLAERSVEGMPPSLLELGFLRRRFIARRTFDVGSRPATTIYKDLDGEFILVDDTRGNYQGDDGQTYSAMSAGYSYVEWQYLYEIERVNRAIAALDQTEPSDLLPRWESMIEAHAAEEKAGTTTSPVSSESLIPSKVHDSSATDCYSPGTSHTILNPSETDDTTRNIAVSREMKGKYAQMMEPIKQPMRLSRFYHEGLDEATLYNAEWCAETILCLTSAVLDVPLPPDVFDEEAQSHWYYEWQQPVRRLMAATCTLSPQLAWERIDLTIRYMATPGSPSWWQRGPESGKDWRRTKAPITLRNVADRFIFEYAELMAGTWWPSQATPYAGPPIEFASFADREPGDPTTDEVVVVEVPRLRRRRPPLTQGQAEELAKCMLEDVPNLIIDGIREYKPGAWGVDVDTSRAGGITITSVERWYAPPERLIPDIDKAIAYAYAVQSEEVAKKQQHD
jgi:hypothetical protein